ncbi:MAG TPA: hypothetical protein VN257_10615, partial [Actinotalea sp.]|nr:hypothetical protein [Actinotalea sp.]
MPMPATGRVGLGGRAPDEHGVQIVDTPAVRVHHPADLVSIVLTVLGIGLVVVLALYADNTTTGV